MKNNSKKSIDETSDGRYILVKIPRQSIRQNVMALFFPISSDEKFQRTVWILCCIFFLLIGIAIGVTFHGKFLKESTDKPAWKSVSLVNSGSP